MHIAFLQQLPRRFVQVKDRELLSLVSGFGALFCTIGAYFLLLPLRDEAGVSIGTDTLPYLFNVSYVLTLIATPLASAFLARTTVSRGKAVQQLFSIFACSIAVFYLLYHAVPPHHPTAFSAAASLSSPRHRRLFNVLPDLQLPSINVTVITGTADSQQQALSQQSASSKSSNSSQGHVGYSHDRNMLDVSGNAKQGNLELASSARFVRIAFYLWLTLVNLLATSTLWARAADAFDSNAAARLFGFLGAGATLGQLAGSLLAAAWAYLGALPTQSHSQGPPLATLLVSAALLEAAGRLAANMQSASKHAEAVADHQTPPPQHAAAPWQQQPQAVGLERVHSSGKLSQQSLTLGPTQSSYPVNEGKPRSQNNEHSLQPSSGKAWSMQSIQQSLAQLLQGFTLIARSGYLCHVCLHFVLHYIVSTFFYFEKTLVVATAGGSASQMVATFAVMNSLSAGAVAVLQLTATGHLLKRLGIGWSLTAVPAISALLMAAIAMQPTVLTVGIADVLRKTVNYSLARPAREILYTDLTWEEKYKAKVCIDTIILRTGDTIGAAVFKALDKAVGFGPSGLAATAVPICLCWSVVALKLGQKQQQSSKQKDDKH